MRDTTTEINSMYKLLWYSQNYNVAFGACKKWRNWGGGGGGGGQLATYIKHLFVINFLE